MDDKAGTAGGAGIPARWVWIGTLCVLALAWAGLAVSGGNQAYVLLLVLATVWLPAFAWWFSRRMRPVSGER